MPSNPEPPNTSSLPSGARQCAARLALACALCALVACGQPQPASEAACAPGRTASAVAPPSPAAVASARGRVDIEGGIVRLAAPRDGVIAQVLVEEGDRVKAGDLLATLEDELARRSFLLAGREAAQIEQDVHKARLEWSAADREVRRLEPLGADETVARQDLDRARDARALAAVALETARAAALTARARVAVAERELSERRVTAPVDGQIIQRQARPGNGVSTVNITPLFLFAPNAPRIVRAELEEQYLDVVRTGQRVQVVLDAQPQRQWSGQVLRIGRVVGARTPSDDPSERQDDRVVEVVITLEQADQLLIGQRVVARFIGS